MYVHMYAHAHNKLAVVIIEDVFSKKNLPFCHFSEIN